MEKAVTIDGKEYRMRASALIPRLYRHKFGRDAIADMNKLSRSYAAVKAAKEKENATEEELRAAQLSVTDLEIFENMAFLMLKHGGADIPDSPEEWLDGIDGVFDVYAIMPIVSELWAANQHTTSTPVKK